MRYLPRIRWPWLLLAIVVVVVAMIGARLLLAGWVTDYLNRKLDRMGDYHGRIEDVSLHLWRGAYSIDGLKIVQRAGKVPVPLLNAPHTDLSVSWNALLHGSVVADVAFDDPQINFVDGGKNSAQSGKGVNWRQQLESMLPIRLDEVRVRNGTIHFRNYSSTPPVDLEMTHADAVVTNLTNARDAGKRAASLDAQARMLGNAPVSANAKFDPLGSLSDFDFKLKTTAIDLTHANTFLQAYAKLDVASGKGDFVIQLDARDGHLSGYAKPLFQHVKIFSWKQDVEEQHDNPLRIAWEALASGVEAIFKNHAQDQFATRIPISGEIGDSKTGTWEAIVAVLHNAFVEAFRPQFEHLPNRSADDDS